MGALSYRAWRAAGTRAAIRFGIPATLLALVVGARWTVIDRFGTDLPFWDQWDAEGVHLLAPWFEHRMSLAQLFSPQNEHRSILTKLLNLLLTVLNGQWDQRLECAVNAFLPGLIAASLFVIARRTLRAAGQAPLFVFLAALYGLPLAWQNVLGGWQSAQFFLIGLALAAIVWLPEAAPWSRRWWLGAAAAVLSLGSMASGCLAAAVVIGLLLVRLAWRRVSWRSAAPALILGAVVFATGILTRVSVPYHEALKAHNLRDFVMTIVLSLQWPMPIGVWFGLALWLPWAWVAGQVLFRSPSAESASGLRIAGLGGWVLLQIVATAYARGAGGPAPASRYIDTLVFGTAVNALAIGWLGRSGGWRRFFAAGLALAFTVAAGQGVALQLPYLWRSGLPSEREYYFYCEQNTRNYLATGDPAYLEHQEIPYPSVPVYRWRLDTPSLRALLPASVRPPVSLRSRSVTGDFFATDSRAPQGRRPPPSPDPKRTGFSVATPPLTNRITWGSSGRGGAAATGEWESAPLAGRHGWLKFEVAGQIGAAETTLELRDAATHRLLATVRPGKTPNDGWRAAYVRAPRQAFVVRAHDGDLRRWLAFSEPVEMGTLSYWAWQAVKQGILVTAVAAATAVLLGLAAWRKSFEP